MCRTNMAKVEINLCSSRERLSSISKQKLAVCCYESQQISYLLLCTTITNFYIRHGFISEASVSIRILLSSCTSRFLLKLITITAPTNSYDLLEIASPCRRLRTHWTLLETLFFLFTNGDANRRRSQREK